MKDSKGIVRLNIGCGRKLLPYAEGWINIDVIDPPEVVLDTVAQVSGFPFDDKEVNEKTEIVFHAADIRNMKFIATGSVHEVHAYHVVEHMAVNELPQFLAEVKRVLHPELGCFVCEQPNVIKCAQNFLQIMTTKDPNLWYQLGLLGFYGQQDDGSIYELHKWGWWPEALTDVLIRNGFKAVLNQEAKTHAGDKRDFRLLAFVNKVPNDLNNPQPKSQVPTQGAVGQSRGIGIHNPGTGRAEPLVVTPRDSVPQAYLLENIQNSFKLMDKWLERAKVHNKKAWLVSAGPSLKKQIPYLKKKTDNEVIFCVKHALPILLENGIIPEFCVILDPRPLAGKSTHNIVRKDLFKEIPNETTFLVASMTNTDVVEYLKERGANLVGWHAYASGIEKFASKGIKLLIAGGTSAGMRSINIAYNLGFREIEFIGFDSSMEKDWTPAQEDAAERDEKNRAKFMEIFYKTPENKWWSTGELVAQIQDFQNTFDNPADITFNVWTGSNYMSEVWEDHKSKFTKLNEFNPKRVSG